MVAVSLAVVVGLMESPSSTTKFGDVATREMLARNGIKTVIGFKS